MKLALSSNIGKRRTTNQDYADYFLNDSGQLLLILCDGVGGHLGGDVASQRTTQYIGQYFQDLNQALAPDQVAAWIEGTLQLVNKQIYQEAQADKNLNGMGTTIVLALIVDGTIYLGHVGDSRAYIYKEGKLQQYTEDHSLVNELIRAGEITLEESYLHPHRNAVTQSIGLTHPLEVAIQTVPSQEAEMLLLCSDGLTNMVTPEALEELFRSSRQEANFAQQLIAAANEAGGMDNISVIIASDLSTENLEEVSEWK